MEKYIKELSSSLPAPGGGSSSILNAALGISLVSMIANISLNNPKYKDNHNQFKEILNKTEEITKRLLKLKKQDEEIFLILKEAYKDKQKIEDALIEAIKAPKETLDIIYNFTSKLSNLIEITPKLLLSDLGISISHLNSSAEGCTLTILVNTNLLKNKDLKEEINIEVNNKLTLINNLHKDIYNNIKRKLENKWYF